MGCDEGNRLGFMFGLSVETVFNYISHAGNSSFDASVKFFLAEVVCTGVEELAVMFGLVFGFPKCVAFAGGRKQ